MQKTGIIPRVLYEDNHLIIINKMPSEITQGDKTGDEPLGDAVKRYVKEKYQKPGNVFLGVVHRLDRPVSGAVIFARTGKALARLNAMLQKREIRKVYWAVCYSSQSSVDSRQSLQNLMTKDYRLTTNDWIPLIHFLKKNEQQNKSYVYDEPGPGRLKAELRYRIIASIDRYELLEIELMTGRHHQIRAQLAARGMTIKGDLKYGAPRSNPDGSIHLHSRLVEFIHPVSGIQVSVTAPVPDEKIWKLLVK